jgi:hypothetical protein
MQQEGVRLTDKILGAAGTDQPHAVYNFGGLKL